MRATAARSVSGPWSIRQLRPSSTVAGKPASASKAGFTKTSGWSGRVMSAMLTPLVVADSARSTDCDGTVDRSSGSSTRARGSAGAAGAGPVTGLTGSAPCGRTRLSSECVAAATTSRS